MDSYMGDSYLTHCRSLERQSSQPSIWLVLNGVFLTNHMAGTSKTKYNYNQVTTQKPKQQSMKITNIHKTKPNETKTGFRSTFAPSAPRKWIGPILQVMRLHTGEDEEEWDETVQVTGALHQILHIVNDQWCGHSQNLKANAKAWTLEAKVPRPVNVKTFKHTARAAIKICSIRSTAWQDRWWTKFWLPLLRCSFGIKGVTLAKKWISHNYTRRVVYIYASHFR